MWVLTSQGGGRRGGRVPVPVVAVQEPPKDDDVDDNDEDDDEDDDISSRAWRKMATREPSCNRSLVSADASRYLQPVHPLNP